MTTLTLLGRADDITPEWWNRMEDHLLPWCDQTLDEGLPEGFNHFWGCYRREGHTGRHLGIASMTGTSMLDTWVVWDGDQ